MTAMGLSRGMRAAVAAVALGTGLAAQAQTLACPMPAELTPQHLYGLWRAEFSGIAQGATLLFEKHPEYAEGLQGGVTRDGVQARVAGDVDDGVFTLEESVDGKTIAATWNGQVAEASCGKEIRGTWKRANDSREYSFVLRKVPGWQ